MDRSNVTIDPRCTQPPPYAIEIILNLDIFGIMLYSVLTFMAVVSMLVYLEECAYIYRKVPANKKSIIIWVNGAAPVIGTMSCLGMWIPKATMFTDMTSACYFAVVVFKFLTLMLEEVGGDEAFLKRAGKYKLRISTGPCCCCCPCLPHVAITRCMCNFSGGGKLPASLHGDVTALPRIFHSISLNSSSSMETSRPTLFLLKLGSFQFAVLKIALTVLSIVLWTDGTFDLADLTISGAAIWINPFVGVLTIIALWPVSIMFMHLRTTLRTLKIVPKYAMYQLVLVLSQLQTAIINILALNGTIACAPPYSSAARGYMMSQQLLIVEMFIITLVTRLLYRRQYDPLPSDEEDVNENSKMITALQSSSES